MIFARIYLLMMVVTLSGLLSSCAPDRNAGIEVGNPSVTVSAKFTLANGDPIYNTLSKQLSLIPEEQLVWESFQLPLRQVKYYASWYFYMPTDPTEGMLVWPLTSDTTRIIDVLQGDSLSAGLDDMDIPNHSYLKEVGITLDMSKRELHGNWCKSPSNCHSLAFVFPDSVLMDLRFHHEQLQLDSLSEALHLLVSIHTKSLLTAVNVDSILQFVPSDSSLKIQLDSNQIMAFANSFAGLRYQIYMGSIMTSNYLQSAKTVIDVANRQCLRDIAYANLSAEWVFIQQIGGVAQASFPADSTVLLDISEGGKKDYAVQWIQEDVAVVKDRWYKIDFDAWSNQDMALILTRIGRYHAPYDNLDDANEDFLSALSKTPKHYSYEIRAKENNPFGRLEFNVGGYGARKIYLKNLSVVQLEQ